MDKNDCFKAYFDKLTDKSIEFENSGRHIVDDRTFLCKFIWAAVKFLGLPNDSKPKTEEEAEKKYNFYDLITKSISLLTPEEFERTFPIEKEYDGKKYGLKDYFSTKEALNKFEKGEPIFKSGDINDLLWDYRNYDIGEFVLTGIDYIDDIRQLQGLPSTFEEFAQNEGLEIYHTYTDETTGKEFMIDGNGKTIPLSKPRPHNLRVIQGGKR